jgi:hypothetical protein
MQDLQEIIDALSGKREELSKRLETLKGEARDRNCAVY